jgi:hypothetical protein
MLNLTAPRLNSGRSSFVAPARHKRLSPAEPSPELTAYRFAPALTPSDDRFAPALHRTTASLLHPIARPLRSCTPSDDRFAPAPLRTTASLPAIHRTAAPLPALHRTTAPLLRSIGRPLRSCTPSDDRFAPALRLRNPRSLDRPRGHRGIVRVICYVSVVRPVSRTNKDSYICESDLTGCCHSNKHSSLKIS